MQLYYSPGACSLSPHIALLEAGLPVTLHKVDLAAKTVEGGGNYLDVNSKGSVPALKLDNGQVLTEGPAIVQYIADLKPEAGLAPKAGSMERYRLQEWLNFITSELHKPIGSMFNKAQTPEWKEAVVKKLHGQFDWLSKQLEGKSFLAGDHFSVADGYLFTVLNWTNFIGFDLKPWPALTAYQGRVAARPKVQAALKAEGLVK
jgi:glutathione S-transferase